MRCIIILFVLFVGLCQADLPTELPDLDDFDIIKTKCDKEGGEGTFDKLKKAQEETEKCAKGLIDIETVKTEVEEAKKTGSMDEVFGKYCKKRPQMKECVEKTLNAAQACMSESEKATVNTTLKSVAVIVEKIGDFACYRDGDRIAMFIAEDGFECLNSRKDGIINCFNQTVKFNPNSFSLNSIPNFTVDKKKCDDLTTIQNCVVKDLEENCKKSTPANMVDALFRFIKKNACKDPKTKRSIRLKRDVKSLIRRAAQAELGADIVEKLQVACEKYGGKDAYNKLMASYNHSMNCLKPIRLFLTPYRVFQRILTNCTAGFREQIRNCLTDEGKYYPDFVLERSQSLYSFMYSHAGKFLGRWESNVEYSKCVQVIDQEEPRKEMARCFQQVTNNLNNTIFQVPPKSKQCRILAEREQCLSTVIKNACVKDIRITKFIDDFFKSLQIPCQKTGANES